MKELKRQRFYVQTAVFSFNLSPKAFYVYCFLCKCANADGNCFPNRETISKFTGLCKSSITIAVRELVEKKVITAKERYQPLHTGKRRQTSNFYQVLELPPPSGAPVRDFVSADGMVSRPDAFGANLGGFAEGV